MKQASLALLLVLLTACSSILPGNDPVVVRSEQSVQVAVEVFNAFLKVEYDNREALKRLDPKIYTFAEKLRHESPRWISTANGSIRAYKRNRSPEGKATLITAVSVLEHAVIEARRYLATTPTPNP